MAEDMVARSAISCGLGDLGLAPYLNSRKMCQALNMLTTTGLDLLGSDAFRGPTAAPQVQNSPVQSTASLESLDNRKSNEVTSCVADIWPWASSHWSDSKLASPKNNNSSSTQITGGLSRASVTNSLEPYSHRSFIGSITLLMQLCVWYVSSGKLPFTGSCLGR